MAKIELGIGLDTSGMQEGAKAASASLGQLYMVGALKREFEQYINDVVKEGFYADFKAGL